LDAAISLTESKLRKQREAVAAKKQKKLKSRLEKLERTKQSQDKLTSEIIEKISAKVNRCALDYASAQQAYVEARLKRLQIGEEEWMKHGSEFLLEKNCKWIEKNTALSQENKEDISDQNGLVASERHSIFECLQCKQCFSTLWDVVCHTNLDH
jgi:hypothetical protein